MILSPLGEEAKRSEI